MGCGCGNKQGTPTPTTADAPNPNRGRDLPDAWWQAVPTKSATPMPQ